MMKIVFCTRECWPGVRRNLDSIKKIIEEMYPEADIQNYEVPNVPDMSFVHLLRGASAPDFLFIGGWDGIIKNIVMNSNRTKTKIFLNWCSPLSQIDLGGEIPLFFDVVNFMGIKEIDYVTVLLESDYKVLREMSDRFVYAPVYNDFSALEDKRKGSVPRAENEINCDMFCAANPRKNILNQIFALGQLPVRTHINFSQPMYVEAAKRYLKHPVIHGWVDRQKYLDLIQSMDFAMQVTLSEGYNITLAEHFYYDVPVICPWFLPYFKNKTEIADLLVNDPTDCSEVREKVLHLFGNKNARKELGNIGKKLILEDNQRNKQILKELLRRVLGA
jgi:hypothetical protein